MSGPLIDFTEEGRYTFAKYLGITHWICIIPSFICLISALYIQLIIEDKISFIENYNGAVLPAFLVFTGSVGFFTHILCGKIIYSNRLVEKREKWSKFLILVVLLTFIIFLLELIGSIMCYIHVSDLGESFDKGIRSAMRLYQTDMVRKEELDVLQMTYECCGSKSYSEWFSVPWLKPDRIEDSNRMINDVPFSCCNPESKRPCIKHRIHENGYHYNYDYKSGLTIHKRGCATILMEFYENSVLTVIGAIILSLSFIQLISSIACRILQTAVTESVNSDDPEGPSQGYIFGKAQVKVLDDTMTTVESTEPANTTEETVEGIYEVPMDYTDERRYVDMEFSEEPHYENISAEDQEPIYNEGEVEEYLAMKFARSKERFAQDPQPPPPPPPPLENIDDEPVYENAPLLRKVRSDKGSFMTLNTSANYSHYSPMPSKKSRVCRNSYPSPVTYEDRYGKHVIDLSPEQDKYPSLGKHRPSFSLPKLETKMKRDTFKRPRRLSDITTNSLPWTRPKFETFKVQPTERKNGREIYLSSPKKLKCTPLYGSMQRSFKISPSPPCESMHMSVKSSPKRSSFSPVMRAAHVPFIGDGQRSPSKRRSRSRSNSASPGRQVFRSGSSFGCHHGMPP